MPSAKFSLCVARKKATSDAQSKAPEEKILNDIRGSITSPTAVEISRKRRQAHRQANKKNTYVFSTRAKHVVSLPTNHITCCDVFGCQQAYKMILRSVWQKKFSVSHSTVQTFNRQWRLLSVSPHAWLRPLPLFLPTSLLSGKKDDPIVFTTRMDEIGVSFALFPSRVSVP